MANTDNQPGAESGAHGTSYVYNSGTTPQTRVAVSQKVRVITPQYGGEVEAQRMGVLSEFSTSQSRTIDTVRGIGFGDIIAELVPGVTDAETGDFTRALLNLMNLFQATGYAGGVDGPVRSLRHHRWPFDVEEQMVVSLISDYDLVGTSVGQAGAGTGANFTAGIKSTEFGQVTNDGRGNPGDNRSLSAILTLYETCWLNSFSRAYSADSGLITESGSITITDTHDSNSNYGEFLASGNDPTIGQVGSVRFEDIVAP
jgi:hypothetical protein